MSKQKDRGAAANPSTAPSPKPDTRANISTADDINVDEDNAIESPKKSLTATEPEKPKR
ncbi:MAG: hypothetical protein WBF88_17345 [Pusillimonas sp.]